MGLGHLTSYPVRGGDGGGDGDVLLLLLLLLLREVTATQQPEQLTDIFHLVIVSS